MARFDIDYTTEYEEFEGSRRPIDSTYETVEKTRRDGDLVKIAMIALAAIIIVFVLVGALALVKLEDIRKSTSLIPPCTESVSPAIASLPPQEAGTSLMMNLFIADGSVTDAISERCSGKTDSLSWTSTEGRMWRVRIGAPTEASARQLWKHVEESISTWPELQPLDGGDWETSRGPVTLCRHRAG